MHGWSCPAPAKGLRRALGSMPICYGSDQNGSNMIDLPIRKRSMEQDQFLTILSREDALARFESALFPRAIPRERRSLADAVGQALAGDVVSPIDVPPF